MASSSPAALDSEFTQFHMPSRSFPGELPMFTNNGLPVPPGMSPSEMAFLSPAAFETRPSLPHDTGLSDPSKISAPKFTPSRNSSPSGELPMFTNNGLPSPPGMSPSETGFLSPAAFESRPPSPGRPNVPSPSTTFAPKFAPSRSSTPEPFAEDEEMICIKLLTHLKKNPSERERYESQLQLIKKTNAAIRRLLKSRVTENDYSCQLLLSTISIHLVAMCERICQYRPLQSEFLHDEFSLDASMVEQQTAEIHDSAKAVVNEAAVLCSSIGDLLRKKALNSPQMLGRHETLHIELDVRLKKALLILS